MEDLSSSYKILGGLEKVNSSKCCLYAETNKHHMKQSSLNQKGVIFHIACKETIELSAAVSWRQKCTWAKRAINVFVKSSSEAINLRYGFNF